MRSICLVLLVLLIKVDAGNVWLKDLISPKGWNLGYGVALKLNESHKGKNLPIMDRLSLDLNFGQLAGVSFAKAESDGVALDFYVKKNIDYEEGRSHKNNHDKHNMMKMMIGYKAALIITVMFAMVKLLSFKAILVAKMALMISIIALIMKLRDHRPHEIIEVEQREVPSHQHYHEKDIGYGHGYAGSYNNHYAHQVYARDAQPSNIYQDVVYAPSGAGINEDDSNDVYSTGPQNDSSFPVGVGRKGNDIERRRDSSQAKKIKGLSSGGSRISIKKYASSES